MHVVGRNVSLRVVIERTNVANLDVTVEWCGRFELKSIVSGISGRRGLRVRDREAPGSNPGPPTSF